MAVVWIVSMSAYQIVGMPNVRNRFMPAPGSMLMSGVVPVAAVGTVARHFVLFLHVRLPVRVRERLADDGQAHSLD
jgi:hypothetical protein